MAVDKLVDSTQLDADLASVANAIRAKSGGSGSLAFPAGFVSEIGNISGGGGGVSWSLLASGSFTRTGTSPVNLSIPVSYAGTPRAVLVCVDEPLADTAQGIAEFRIYESGITELFGDNSYISAYYPNGLYMFRTRSAANAYAYVVTATAMPTVSGTTITANRITAGNIWQPNTYKWYIWGEAST